MDKNKVREAIGVVRGMLADIGGDMQAMDREAIGVLKDFAQSYLNGELVPKGEGMREEEIMGILETMLEYDSDSDSWYTHLNSVEDIAKALSSHFPKKMSRERIMDIIDKAIQPRLESEGNIKDFIYPTHSFKVVIADALLKEGV